MADIYGPNDIYSNIPPLDDRGENQIAKFLYWNPDPIGTSDARLAQIHPDMQAVINKAKADNPNLPFIVGSGLRSQADQQNAYKWGWSTVNPNATKDVNQRGIAADLWPLDANGKPTFNPQAMTAVGAAVKKAASDLGVPITWGGDWNTFKDRSHFQLNSPSPGYTPGQPLAAGPQPNLDGKTAPPPAPGTPAMSGKGAYDTSPAAAPTSSAQAQGTTINSSNVIDTLSRNIAQIESGTFKNPYQALNPTTHAIGKYQVMPANVPGWTLAATGKQMTPDEFKASPAAQEAVFRDQMQRNLQLYSPRDAASIWFTGKPFNVAGGNVRDAVGTTNANYVARATAGLPDSGTFTPGAAVASATTASTPTPTGTTINTTGTGSGSVLPGFADAKTSNQFLQNLDQFDKSLGGRGLGLQGQGQGEGQGQPDMPRPPVIPPPGLRNASSAQSIGMAASQMLPGLTHYQPQPYGQTLNSDPLAIGAGTPQQPDWLKNAGLQQAAPPSPYGTSIGSMQMAYGLSPQQLQMMMNPMMLAQSGGFS